MRLSALKRVREEEGFTVAVAVMAMFLVAVLAAGALAAANGDLNLTQNDLNHKRAYQAAQAGIADYAFHLNSDTNYWAKCTSVPTPNAVNQQGSTTNRRSVAGSTTESYALELLPATGQSACSTVNPTTSMLEPSGPNAGSFRIRSTGYAANTKQSVVATFKRASFLDYVYFTQLETSDPVTYGNAATIAGANTQCTKTIQQGRYNAPIPGSSPQQNCSVIVFKDGEQINGPVHTNDALVVCGRPTFGRNAADVIEVSSPPQGWFGGTSLGLSSGSCPTANPSFVGTYITNAPVLTPPPTNTQLSTIVQPAYTFTGQTYICVNGTTMTVGNNGSCTGGTTQTVNLPSNGVVYVKNGTGCSSSYSPFTATYPATSGCGNVYVHGNYNGQLTIAAENDIIIDGNVTRANTNSMLGLIANNFVRVYHPVCPGLPSGCVGGTITSETSAGNCGTSPVNGTGSISNLTIQAAILAISHSFIVDHYDCPANLPLGNLTISGAISQKFRGAVGTFSGTSTVTGYTKNYNYDDRLRYMEPPHFLDPVQSAWHIQRETLDFP
jgi:Tfp pilus assembly protein PilX